MVHGVHESPMDRVASTSFEWVTELGLIITLYFPENPNPSLG